MECEFLKIEVLRFLGRLKKRRHLLSSVSIRPDNAVQLSDRAVEQCKRNILNTKTSQTQYSILKHQDLRRLSRSLSDFDSYQSRKVKNRAETAVIFSSVQIDSSVR